MTKKIYKVDTIINGNLSNRLVFDTRTRAQKHILANYNAFSNDNRFHIHFTHFSKWGVYKKSFNNMCIDKFIVTTKDLNICIELTEV
jgi:hypothetical protein